MVNIISNIRYALRLKWHKTYTEEGNSWDIIRFGLAQQYLDSWASMDDPLLYNDFDKDTS